MQTSREDGALVDQFGRVATDLRVSLTDVCNLRCTYCMPADGLAWLPREELLTDTEVMRLVALAVETLGVTKVRFTGVEPLLRPGLVDIVAHTSGLSTTTGPTPDVALTTNGLGLDARIPALMDAGLRRINISLDTLDRERFAAITRRDRLDDVLRGIDAAVAAGLRVKVNAVAQPESYREDAPALLRYCLERGIELRFIEQMPIGPATAWDRARIVTADHVRDALTAAGAVLGAAHVRGAAPAERVDVRMPGVPDGTLGLVASVTAPFCRDCTRTRLTADGQVRSCLFSRGETDLRGPLRGGTGDAEVAHVWREAMWGKPRAHGLGQPATPEFARASRTMSRIGG